MSGFVVGLWTAAAAGAEPAASETVELDAGQGIRGDRYYGTDPDAQITLVDADAIDAVNEATGWALMPEDSRRNIVTRGVNLNQWETGRFRVGAALLEGVELCEPCASLGRMLADDSRSAAEVVAALTHRAGLRARVIEGGPVRAGDLLADA